MSASELVSVIIVAHDDWPELGEAIESALSQSWPAVEVVVVDNDSMDGTDQKVAAAFASRVKYVRQSNKLDGGGRNRGVAECSGDFIQFLDGDDLLAADKVALQLETFASRPDADIVYGDAREFDVADGVKRWSDWDSGPQDDMLAALVDPDGNGAGLVVHSGLFRRSALDRIGPWDETLSGADIDYWLRAAWTGCVFVYSPGSWCYHRRHPGTLSTNGPLMYDRMIRTLDKAAFYVDREPYRSQIRRRLAGLRYANALTNLSLDRSGALEELATARELDPERISLLPWAAGLSIVSVPGARRVMKSRALEPLRRLTGHALGVLGR